MANFGGGASGLSAELGSKRAVHRDTRFMVLARKDALWIFPTLLFIFPHVPFFVQETAVLHLEVSSVSSPTSCWLGCALTHGALGPANKKSRTAASLPDTLPENNLARFCPAN